MKYKYFIPIGSIAGMVYRVNDTNKICQFVSTNSRNWKDSCLDHLGTPSNFRRISRDAVRNVYPKLFR